MDGQQDRGIEVWTHNRRRKSTLTDNRSRVGRAVEVKRSTAEPSQLERSTLERRRVSRLSFALYISAACSSNPNASPLSASCAWSLLRSPDCPEGLGSSTASIGWTHRGGVKFWLDSLQALQLTNEQSPEVLCVRSNFCHCSFVYSALSDMFFVRIKLCTIFF